MKIRKKIKKIRLHHEGTHILIAGFILLAILNLGMYYAVFDRCNAAFYIVLAITVILYAIAVNFFRCPIRIYDGVTKNVVVAPADGKVVVIEEVDENEYFHEKRIMVSIFMSLFNVHANWYPVEGTIMSVKHHSGRFMEAWLPKASTDNERSTVIIKTPEGVEVLTRQVAGAVARRIVTYAEEGDQCYIDEHMGFIKFGSRVDVYLPLGTEINVKLGQQTVGNETVIAKLK